MSRLYKDRDQLAIVIPTRGRWAYLRRLLDFICYCGVDRRFNIYIFDGSIEHHANRMVEDRDLDIKVFAFPYDADHSCFLRKMFEGYSFLTEEFCMFMSEDDLINPGFIDFVFESGHLRDSQISCLGGEILDINLKEFAFFNIPYFHEFAFNYSCGGRWSRFGQDNSVLSSSIDVPGELFPFELIARRSCMMSAFGEAWEGNSQDKFGAALAVSLDSLYFRTRMGSGRQ